LGVAIVLLAISLVTGCESTQQREDHLRLTAEVTALTLENTRLHNRIDEVTTENLSLKAEVDELTQNVRRLEGKKTAVQKPLANAPLHVTTKTPADGTADRN